ncbi:PQQ-dependent sugar dehydrogenase [Streptosporangium sp. NPDC020072]|uniref:PQQ-dependent sugar dehydrogenase n=1 Tax=unclassified Streptosporangium TaxID=2632669 RepID=UPI00331B21A0
MTTRTLLLRLAAPALALIASATLTACAPDQGAARAALSSARAASATPLAPVTTIADGLDAPWSIAFHGRTALVSERDTARVVEIGERGAVRQVGVIEAVTPMGEGGLLGIAVRNGFLYAYYTANDGNRIERFELTGTPGRLGLGRSSTVLDGLPSASYHNGGRIAFGPDGMLYATVGDAGDRPAAQDKNTLAGKILRMTPEGKVPPDNPFAGSLVYSFGHRNPQGIAWDSGGTLYASEFGQDTWDELNVIRPGGNYGWPEVEGIAGRDGFTDPVQQWPPAEASPSGMAITNGTIYLANLRGRLLRQIPLDRLSTSTQHLAGRYGRLRDAVVAPDGSLWVLTNNTDGRGTPGPGDDRILRVAIGG